jgi:hypothetical protein
MFYSFYAINFQVIMKRFDIDLVILTEFDCICYLLVFRFFKTETIDKWSS